MSKFVLLDRDGVINRRVVGGYVTSWSEFVFLPGALDALRLLTQEGYTIIVISNQACVGKGLLTSFDLEEITRRFVREVADAGGCIHAVYYCPHRDEDDCECRKPKPGLLLQAQKEQLVNFADSFFVGDSVADLLAAQSVGCPSILVSDSKLPEIDGLGASPLAMVPSLYDAVQIIIGSGESFKSTYA